MLDEKRVIGVRVISILYFIGTIWGILFGLVLIFTRDAGRIINTLPLGMVLYGFMGKILNGVISFILYLGLNLQTLLKASQATMIIGIALTIIATLDVFIGIGLWKEKNWARKTAIVFASLGIISVIFLIIKDFKFDNIIGLILSIFILVYFLFNKTVRSNFSGIKNGNTNSITK